MSNPAPPSPASFEYSYQPQRVVTITVPSHKHSEFVAEGGIEGMNNEEMQEFLGVDDIHKYLQDGDQLRIIFKSPPIKQPENMEELRKNAKELFPEFKPSEQDAKEYWAGESEEV